MRAAARFDAENPVLWQRTAFGQEFRIFLREDIVRHHGQAVPVTQCQAERLHQCRLAGPHWTSDSNHRDVTRACRGHASIATEMLIGSMHDTPSPPKWRICHYSSAHNYPVHDLNKRDSKRLWRMA